MPPKKVQEPERKPLIGRVGTNLRVGIVGIPNVGKSTFFNVLTKSQAAAENFPFCTIDPNENKYNFIVFHNVIRQKDTKMSRITNVKEYEIDYGDLADFTPDQTLILNKKHFKSIVNSKYKESCNEPPKYDDWYPQVNSYYSHTEDVDAFARVNHLLEDRPSLCSLNSASSHEYHTKRDAYASKLAQLKYLNTKPICFLVLGKPGIDQEEIARRFAEQWRCVYVDPLILLEDEIRSQSRAGQCIEFNLRCGRAVGVDVIMRLLAKKVQAKAAKHRGYVIAGFPLVPNDLFEEDPISSESAIFNVKEIFEDIVENVLDMDYDISKRQVSMSSRTKSESVSLKTPFEGNHDHDDDDACAFCDFELSLDSAFYNNSNVCIHSEIGTDIHKQINLLFGLFSQPYVIIYVACPTGDVISRRADKYFDIYSKRSVDLAKIRLFYELGGLANPDLTSDLFEVDLNPLIENPNLRHLVRVPENLESQVATQLDRYYSQALKLIDQKVILHDVQYYMKVDGRAFITRTLENIKLRLRTLPVQKVLIPEKFKNFEIGVTGGEDPQTVDDLNDLSVDEAFEKFSRRQIVNPGFNWHWSDWKNFCPVSMKDGTYRKGLPKHAVRFMNRIFFLSDEEAVNSFIENPRTYLMPPFPKVSCKIFVFGPPLSGKSTVSTCLSYLLDGTVLQPREMYLQFVKLKELEIKEKVRQSALIEGVKLLEEKNRLEFESNKIKRAELIKNWEESCVFCLRIILEIVRKSKTSFDDVSPFPMRLDKKSHSSIGDEENQIFLNLQELNIPVDKEYDFYLNLLENPSQLVRDHLPDSLKAPISVKEASVFDPFVEKYANDKSETIEPEDVEISDENVFEMYYNGFKEVETHFSKGWVVDGMTTDPEMLKRICDEFKPHEVFILNGSRNFLTQIFDDRDRFFKFRDFRQFFLTLGETDAAWRTPSQISTDTFKEKVAVEILENIVNEIVGLEDVEENRAKFLAEIAEFDSNVDKIRALFKERDCDLTEIDITDLSIEAVMKEVIDKIGNKFRQGASLFTDEDRAEEVQEFLALQGAENVNEGESGPRSTLERLRKFGDTADYCPVTFQEHWVLWKGKEEFTAKYKGRIYLCSSQVDLDKFLACPKSYLLQVKPPDSFPPPRICVVGVGNSGKSAISKRLASNLGVRYCDYQQFLIDEVNSSKTTILSSSLDLDHYLGSDQPLPDHVLQKFTSILWFDYPVRNIGFVSDGFPMRPSDIAFMTANKTIPDLIVCISVEQAKVLENTLNSSLEKWKLEVEDRRKSDNLKRNLALKEWEEERAERFNVLMEGRRQARYSHKLEGIAIPEEGEGDAGLLSSTQISFDSVAELEDSEEINRILDEELPEPIEIDEHAETEQEALERLALSIENDYLNEIKYLYDIKAACQVHSIPWVEINGNTNLDKTVNQAFRVTDSIKFANKSRFEVCREVTPEIAEKLLSHGYYFLSRFGRTCPVQIYDKYNPIQMLLPGELSGTVRTVIHRQYVYFIVGAKNRDRFIDDPLKFTSNEDYQFPLKPMRLAVIGPPKSGKSRLARRYGRDFGFKVVTRGQALRALFHDLPFSNLLKSVEAISRRGDELDDDSVLKAVQASCFDGYVMTQGVVFDGFPNSKTEIELLNRFGLVPHLIFDLQPRDDQVYKNAALVEPDDPNLQGFPYSKRFIRHLLELWKIGAPDFRIWCDREFQNVYKLRETKQSLWGIWHDSLEVTLAVFSEIKHYFKHANDDWPLRIANMLITPLEFLERQSGYKTYCPGCLRVDKLKSGGDPPDRTGLIHFTNNFYWLCPDHIEAFLKTPEAFIPPLNKSLPYDLPSRLSLNEGDDISNLVEDGLCVVCYEKGKPERHLVKGLLKFAVRYCNRTYLFDSIQCLNEFMSSPLTFSEVVIRFKGAPCFSSVAYGDLPILGLLEQYVARKLVKAVHHVGIHRPVIPGLGISTSALIGIGLFLKIHNSELSDRDRAPYEGAFTRFHQKRNDFLRNLKYMKDNLNPLLGHKEPDTSDSFDSGESDADICAWEVLDSIIDKIGSTVVSRRVPVPDERFDYLCEYFKPLSKVPAFLNVVDIAGLVKGASEGQGLGNAFLSHISACDAIFHLCRAFEDDDVTHVEGEVNPVRDLDIISEELRLKDEEVLEKNLEKLERTVIRGTDKKLKPEYDTLVKVKTVLIDEKKHIRFGDWDLKDIDVLNKYLFLTSKPTIYLVNLSEKDYIKKKNKWLIKIKEWVDKNDPGALIIPFSGAFEYKLMEEYGEDPAGKKKFLEESNVTSALDKIIVQGYKALQLEYFFTAGPDEVKAWIVQKGTKAPQAAGRIHTDFEKGFIMAEVMKFVDFKEEGTEVACKAAGKYRQQGRNYTVEDGDIIFFKFNAGAGLKDPKKK